MLEMDHLAILSKTISDHAHKLAHEEWNRDHDPGIKSCAIPGCLNRL
jgi:hypothetical protein